MARFVVKWFEARGMWERSCWHVWDSKENSWYSAPGFDIREYGGKENVQAVCDTLNQNYSRQRYRISGTGAVCLVSETGMWEARGPRKGKNGSGVFLGRFSDETQAHAAADEHCISIGIDPGTGNSIRGVGSAGEWEMIVLRRSSGR